jgi:hypothetical protein
LHHVAPSRVTTLTLRSIIGFDELGGHDDFPTIHLEWLLAKWKVALMLFMLDLVF